MKVKDIVFHIHYCNEKQFIDITNITRTITKKIQHHELIYIKGSSGKVTIGNKTYSFKNSIILYICPEVMNSINVDIIEPKLFLSVHFSFANINFMDGRWEISNELSVLSLQPAKEIMDYHGIEDVFKRLAESWKAKLPGYEFIARTLLQQLFIAVYRNNRMVNHNYSNLLKVDKVIEYMNNNIDSKITLSELSKYVNLSPSYLSRSFKETTGYSVIEYFNKIKIDKAKELLLEGNISIKAASRELGFMDEFYFSRIFKKLAGVSPSDFIAEMSM